MTRTEIAHAKLNLALHVRRRRADGYHDIETVFAFCEDGDQVVVSKSEQPDFKVSGPFASQLTGQNIVCSAVDAFRASFSIKGHQHVALEKNLPVASGIGGGSADAAATLRALASLFGKEGVVVLDQCAASLGADVPACMTSMTSRGAGIGQTLTSEAAVTGTPVLLVNPRVPLSTAAVFAGWDGVDRGPLGGWREGRNDLEAPARAMAPAIGDVLDWLSGRSGATHVRMSGSGATCFALFDGVASRDVAAAGCPEEWWHMASRLR